MGELTTPTGGPGMSNYLLNLNAFMQWCKLHGFDGMAEALRAEALAHIAQTKGFK